MENQEKSKRKRWTREETLGLLQCFFARKDEFEHSRRKRYAYSNVLEDMIGKGITDSNTTTLCLESKMRTLLNAYKASKDNNNRTGASPSNAPFMKEMDDIFGDKPIIGNNHTLHAGYKPIEVLGETLRTHSPDVEDMSSNLSTPVAATETQAKRKRCSMREIYLQKKIALKKEAYTAREAQRMESLKKMQDFLKAKWEKEAETEKKKIRASRINFKSAIHFVSLIKLLNKATLNQYIAVT